MKPPILQVSCGPHLFSLVFDKKALKAVRKKRKQSTDVIGCVDFEKLTIHIDHTIPESLMQASVLHELLHICNWLSGIQFEYLKPKERALEEITVLAVECQLLHMIQRNPALFAWIGEISV